MALTLADKNPSYGPYDGIAIERSRWGRRITMYVLGAHYVRWAVARRFRSIKRQQIHRDDIERSDLGGEG